MNIKTTVYKLTSDAFSRLLIAPAALGPLRVAPASSKFPDEARHPSAAA